MSKAIGILGGTFDPIPCYQSPFKKRPLASDEQRLIMLELAAKNHPEFIIDDCELQRKEISYTIDTIQSLHQKFTNTSLCLIMSMDAFAEFKLWRDWQKISQLTNLVIADRSDTKTMINQNVSFININPLPISATKIRALIKEGQDASAMLPNNVWEFIKKNKIYHRK